jgi:hypothetical protein
VTVTKWTWLIISVIYVAFFSWYTSFKEPLTQQEIDHYLEKVEAKPEELASFRKFMEDDDGNDFVMINIMEMNDTPLQIEGVEPGETTDQVLAKYIIRSLPGGTNSRWPRWLKPSPFPLPRSITWAIPG